MPRQRVRGGQRLALHHQRQGVQLRPVLQVCVVEHHRRGDRPCSPADPHRGHLHHAVLEQVGLQRRAPRRPRRRRRRGPGRTRSGRWSPCTRAGRSARRTAAAAAAGTACRRAMPSSAGHRHVLVQAGDQLRAPDEVRPQRLDARPVAADHQPLRAATTPDASSAGSGRQRHGSTASSGTANASASCSDRQARAGTRTTKLSDRRQRHAEELDRPAGRRPAAAVGRKVTRLVELARCLAARQEDRPANPATSVPARRRRRRPPTGRRSGCRAAAACRRAPGRRCRRTCGRRPRRRPEAIMPRW